MCYDLLFDLLGCEIHLCIHMKYNLWCQYICKDLINLACWRYINDEISLFDVRIYSYATLLQYFGRPYSKSTICFSNLWKRLFIVNELPNENERIGFNTIIHSFKPYFALFSMPFITKVAEWRYCIWWIDKDTNVIRSQC